MEYRHFKDIGIYYSNREMVENNLVLSMNTRLIYDIADAKSIKIIKKTTDEFFEIAQEDIIEDGPCFYGMAAIFKDDVTGNLIWEL
jgi:hypothetical protein